jgi:hypothetical protein
LHQHPRFGFHARGHGVFRLVVPYPDRCSGAASLR